MYIISLLLCHDLLYSNFPRFCTQSLFAWWGSLCYQTPTLQHTQISSKVRSVSVFTTWQCCISNLLPRSKLVLPASCVSSLKENCPLNSEGVGTVPQCLDCHNAFKFTLIPKVFLHSGSQNPLVSTTSVPSKNKNLEALIATWTVTLMPSYMSARSRTCHLWHSDWTYLANSLHSLSKAFNTPGTKTRTCNQKKKETIGI